MQATLISDNPELNGEAVDIIEKDYPNGQGDQAMVTLISERVVFLWPTSKLSTNH
jgi:hypothetical protein